MTPIWAGSATGRISGELLMGDGLNCPVIPVGHPAHVWFSSKSVGWLFFGQSSAYRTRGGGVHWTEVALPRPDGILTAVTTTRFGLLVAGGGEFASAKGPDGPNYALERPADGGWQMMRAVVFTRWRGEKWTEHILPGCATAIFDLQPVGDSGTLVIGDFGCTYISTSSPTDWRASAFHNAPATDQWAEQSGPASVGT